MDTQFFTEEHPEVAIENARIMFLVVAASIPKQLQQKEAGLVDWFARLKGNSLTKLLALYDFMAQLYSSIEKFTPCKKGCTSCCHYPVTIREIEIQLIERESRIRRNRTIRKAGSYHGVRCPFLQNDRCSIYAYRPFVCRRHIALTKTSHWCHPDRANQINISLVNFSEIDRVFDLIVQESGSFPSFDIREVFYSD